MVGQISRKIQSTIIAHTGSASPVGSVFTDVSLVQAASALEPPIATGRAGGTCERKAAQNTFWMGRGGTLPTISGIDIALGYLGQGTGLSAAACSAAACAAACALLLAADGRAEGDVRCRRAVSRAASGVQDRGPFGAARCQARQAIVAARGGGSIAKPFVDAGASDALWPHGFKWAKRTARC